MNTRTHITTAALAIAGGGLWFFAGTALKDAGRFENQPNPLGIKRSPYGQVIAMAIQTPIDGDWHGGLEVHGHGEDGHDHGEHGHDHGDHGHTHSHDDPSPAAEGSILSRLHFAVSQRTNPNPPTAGHQFYLRREIEKKLRFAYELDPSHYAN